MSHRILRLLSAGLLCVSVPLHAALQIEGVTADVQRDVQGSHPEAFEALVKRFKVTAKGGLQFKLAGRALRINPWVSPLPQRLAPQYVRALMMVHPAGPMQFISFRKPQDSIPWLTLTASGGQRSQLLPDQVLGKINEGYVYLLKQREPLRVDLGQAVILRDDQTQTCWQFVLLGTTVPKGAAKFESEPRADWSMQRFDGCPRIFTKDD